jgi:hypothetical protein
MRRRVSVLVALLATGLAALLGGNDGASARQGDWPTPPGDASLEWQLVAPWNTDADADVYDIDLLEAVPTRQKIKVGRFGSYVVRPGQNAGAIAELHAQGRFVVCYIDTGAWEIY